MTARAVRPIAAERERIVTDGNRLRVFDDFLPDAEAYRAQALGREYRTFDFPEVEVTFHGIAPALGSEAEEHIVRMFPAAEPTLSFFRRSPAGQQEPHYIHTDADMGDWSAILYLNPEPPPGDGTVFWTHMATGARESAVPHERSREGQTPNGWKPWRTVTAKFNRLLMFPSVYFHSRAIYDNWGAGDGARLTQVTFGKGDILR